MNRLLFLLLCLAFTQPAAAQGSWTKNLDGFRQVLKEEGGGKPLIKDELVSLSEYGEENSYTMTCKDGAAGYIIVVAYSYAPGHNPDMSGYFEYIGDNAHRVKLTKKGRGDFYYLYAKVSAKPGYEVGRVVVKSPLRDYAIPCQLLIGQY
jgi:hypothetical protein